MRNTSIPTILIGSATVIILALFSCARQISEPIYKPINIQPRVDSIRYSAANIKRADSLISVLLDLKLAPIQIQEDEPSRNQHSPIKFSAYDMQHVRTNNHRPFKEQDTVLVQLKNEFSNPLPNAKLISQYMGRRRSHTGVDLKTKANDTIKSAFDGKVRLAKRYGAYGNVIVIRHYNGLETVYSHNSKNLVKAGDEVKSGQPIGLTGRTGRATTEHLHFEVRVKGKHVNPNLFFNFTGQEIEEDKMYLIKRPGDNFVIRTPRDIAKVSKKSTTKSSTLKSSTATNTANTTTSTTTAQSDTEVYYIVKSGDSLDKIARKTGSSVNNICELNDIKKTTVLRIGRKLRVK